MKHVVSYINSRLNTQVCFRYNTLRVSTGLHEMDGLQWHLVVVLFAAWVIIFLCLMKGVKSVGKVCNSSIPF